MSEILILFWYLVDQHVVDLHALFPLKLREKSKTKRNPTSISYGLTLTSCKVVCLKKILPKSGNSFIYEIFQYLDLCEIIINPVHIILPMEFKQKRLGTSNIPGLRTLVHLAPVRHCFYLLPHFNVSLFVLTKTYFVTPLRSTVPIQVSSVFQNGLALFYSLYH